MRHALAVVCNAGPLIVLGKLNRLELLADLYGRVHIPHTVYDEVVRHGLQRGDPDAQVVRLFLKQRQWPVVDVSPSQVAALKLSVTLGRGETAVLALATSLNEPLVLMDDARARAEARRLQFSVYGSLGILVQAYQQHHLSLPEVEFLIQNIAARADIWISAQLCQRVLARLHSLSS